MWQALQRKAAEQAATAPPAATPSRGDLPVRLRAGIEQLSGLAMDDVRVHRNSPEPARLGAHAFTRGSDIHLGPGQERHLPHEAWHVVQQAQGRVAATRQMKGRIPINDDGGLEREADAMGAAALQKGDPAAAFGAPARDDAMVRPGAAAKALPAVAQLTTVVDQKRTQKLVKDSGKGKLSGTEFEWQSKFDVDIVKDKVVVTIRIKANIEPKLFETVWAPQVTRQWSDRFMVKVGSKSYPIVVQLLQVEKGEHYAVKAVKSESALYSGARGHFGTSNMTEWGVHDTTNIAHEVGHMLGNVDEYGVVEASGQTRDYLTKPSTTIMAVSANNPVAEHYALIQQAAELELTKLGLMTEKSSSVVPDVSSRLGKEAPKSLSLSELQSASSSLKTVKSEPKKKEEEPPPLLLSMLSSLKPVKPEPKKEEPQLLSALSGLKPESKPKTDKEEERPRKPVQVGINHKQYEQDMSEMEANLKKAKRKFAKHPDSWVVERLCTYIDRTIGQYEQEYEANGKPPRRWCVQATGGFLEDIGTAIAEKDLEDERRPWFMNY